LTMLAIGYNAQVPDSLHFTKEPAGFGAGKLL